MTSAGPMSLSVEDEFNTRVLSVGPSIPGLRRRYVPRPTSRDTTPSASRRAIAFLTVERVSRRPSARSRSVGRRLPAVRPLWAASLSTTSATLRILSLEAVCMLTPSPQGGGRRPFAQCYQFWLLGGSINFNSIRPGAIDIEESVVYHSPNSINRTNSTKMVARRGASCYEVCNDQNFPGASPPRQGK